MLKTLCTRIAWRLGLYIIIYRSLLARSGAKILEKFRMCHFHTNPLECLMGIGISITTNLFSAQASKKMDFWITYLAHVWTNQYVRTNKTMVRVCCFGIKNVDLTHNANSKFGPRLPLTLLVIVGDASISRRHHKQCLISCRLWLTLFFLILWIIVVSMRKINLTQVEIT